VSKLLKVSESGADNKVELPQEIPSIRSVLKLLLLFVKPPVNTVDSLPKLYFPDTFLVLLLLLPGHRRRELLVVIMNIVWFECHIGWVGKTHMLAIGRTRNV
jgi:hypothetical protein